MQKKESSSTSLLTPLVAVIVNLALVYVVYFIARLEYLLENWNYFKNSLSINSIADILHGAWFFDTSAILYTNVIWVVMVLFPLHWKENHYYRKLCKWVFVILNALTLTMNLADSVYFKYTMRRTTSTVFTEFSNEGNMGSIIGTELLRHWYLVLLAVAIIIILWNCYSTPRTEVKKGKWWQYDIAMLLSLAAFAPFCVAGMRGGWTTAVRPITLSNANQFVERPTDAALVLNTPFSMIRSFGKAVFVTPGYYASETELQQVFNPIHQPQTDSAFVKKNVVVFIIESFGREYIGALNKPLEDGQYRGYTPFMDELIAKSAVWEWSFCNGRKSIDGMPSILSGIPMFVEPFFLTPAAMNKVSGLAGELDKKGYETAFFHGAQNGSMGFQAFSRATGFQHYYGRTEYNEDERFRGDEDFDGTWAIWDEPFLQFYATKMSEMKEPFMTAIFTASSHHPYAVPEEYRDTFPEEGIIIHKCIRYTDHALRRFFEKAEKEPWFKNTIFVLTSDHTNLTDHAFYETDMGGFCSPIIIYDPSQELVIPGMRPGIAQQIDIMPTVLGLLHYDQPYLSFGCDLFQTPAEDTYAVNYLNGIYQYFKNGYVLQFDGQKTKAMYEMKDSLMQHNIREITSYRETMERELKAIIQQYMMRMNDDRLTP